MRDDRVDHLVNLIQRIAWLERKISEFGDPRGYFARDVAAVSWAIETLVELDPDLAPLIATAEQIAEDRLARANERRGSAPQPKPFRFDSGPGFDRGRLPEDSK